jgi:hypothetical protein
MTKRCLPSPTLLEKCIERDIWVIIEQFFDVVDALIMCMVSIDIREIFMTMLYRIGKTRKPTLYAMVACRKCGGGFTHWCRPTCTPNEDVKLVEERRGYYKTEMFPVRSISIKYCEAIGLVSIIVALVDKLSPNWDHGHTISHRSIELMLRLNNKTNGSIWYQYGSDSYQANGMCNATLSFLRDNQ